MQIKWLHDKFWEFFEISRLGWSSIFSVLLTVMDPGSSLLDYAIIKWIIIRYSWFFLYFSPVYYHGKDFCSILVRKWQFERVFRSEVMLISRNEPIKLLLVHYWTIVNSQFEKGHYLCSKYRFKSSPSHVNEAEIFP